MLYAGIKPFGVIHELELGSQKKLTIESFNDGSHNLFKDNTGVELTTSELKELAKILKYHIEWVGINEKSS